MYTIHGTDRTVEEVVVGVVSSYSLSVHATDNSLASSPGLRGGGWGGERRPGDEANEANNS